MAETQFMGLPITRQAVLQALQNFDTLYPNTNQYDHWLINDSYKFAIRFKGKLYPPKYILSVITGIRRGTFTGGDPTNEPFKHLGFTIINKPDIFNDTQVINTNSAFLLIWNPLRYSWNDFQDDWHRVYGGDRTRFEWSCGNTKKIAVGDRVFMMRLGWRVDNHGILLSGRVTGEPMQGAGWNAESENQTALYVEFEPDILLNPDTDELFDPTTVSSDFDWHPQRSGVTIPPDIAQELELAWQKHIAGSGTASAGNSEQTDKPRTFKEGQRSLGFSYRYERDPRARDACILCYGTTCAACEFNFGKKYGEIGEDFIHVHHLKPISERGGEYEIDPIRDLRPVCPNCHAMLHQKSPPYSIDELKKIIAEQQL